MKGNLLWRLAGIISINYQRVSYEVYYNHLNEILAWNLWLWYTYEINAESGYEPLAGKGSGMKMFDFLLQEDL